MILGSAPPFGYVVDYCINAGIKTVVCDGSVSSPVKNRAWKAYTVDINDLDALEKIAHENEIDGVFTSSSDILLDIYTRLCARLRLRCTTTENLAGLLFDKRANKEAFLRHGIPTAKYVLLQKDYCKSQIDGMRWPLIVKPSDSSGGKGMTIIRNVSELSDAVKKAFSFSIHKYNEIIVEEFFEGDEVNIECWLENGQLYILSINDKNCIIWNPNEPMLCLSTENPSKYMVTMKNEFRALAKDVTNALGLVNGPLTIQTIVGRHGIAVIEPLGRIAGGNPFIILDRLTGINVCERMVHFALGLPNSEISPSVMDYSGKAKCMILYLRKGQAVSVHGIDELTLIKEIIAVERYYSPHKLPKVETQPFRFAVMHFASDTLEKLKELEKQILATVSVLDENGTEMIINKLI